jgi:hypothetical protein
MTGDGDVDWPAFNGTGPACAVRARRRRPGPIELPLWHALTPAAADPPLLGAAERTRVPADEDVLEALEHRVAGHAAVGRLEVAAACQPAPDQVDRRHGLVGLGEP